MKKILLSLVLPFLALPVHAQQGGFQAEAVMIRENGENFVAWITAATPTAVRYRDSAVSTVTNDARLADFAGIFLVEPPEYSLALDLFQGRKYKEAQEKFAALKEEYRPIDSLKDNHSTLSGFYEMECMRKLGDYEGLASALQNFVKEPLTRDHQLRQIELYVMWDAVRSKSWDRLELICRERSKEILPEYQRAQVAFCHGLALQELKRPVDALNAYSIAMTADAGASEELAGPAVLNSLRIHFEDEEVQVAIKNWGTENENQNTTGFFRLTEAGALAKLYELSLGSNKPLPAEFKDLTKYKVN